jgi:DNA-binding transcriptional MerR regulator
MAAGCWRIDELAQKAGLTVDTIRYYAREGLLAPPERSGRHKLYGPDHLDRLGRIRDLQGRRFSLAAIRAILDTDRPGLETVFAGVEGREYSFEDLVERSGMERDLVEQLRGVGLLPSPEEFGKEAYDDADLGLLRSVAELQGIGMTPALVVELGAIYVRHFRALQHDVHDLFAGKSDVMGDEEELVAMQTRLTANASRMLPAVDRVLNYVHQRTIQRLTLEAVRTAQETHTGVGGVPFDDDTSSGA